MDNYEKIVESLLEYSEEEWFEFKENWFEPHGIGEYISALSNAAAIKGKTNTYFILFFEKVIKTRKDILLNRKITKTNVVCPT